MIFKETPKLFKNIETNSQHMAAFFNYQSFLGLVVK